MHRILLALGAFLAGSAFTAATAGVVEDNEFSAVEEKIRGLVPNTATIAVAETPIPGLLQVQINSEVIYVTADGQYLVQGQIINLDTRMNITDQAKSGIRKATLTGLNPEEQISFAPENIDYDLLVFTDIDCGYCRKLHNQMAEYNDNGIAIHYLAFPRAGVGSASFEKYVSVWCADDQQAAMTLAKNGGETEALSCSNPIAEQYDLGRELGVTGTPAILTSDGMLIPGYVPPVQLRQRLEAMTASVE